MSASHGDRIPKKGIRDHLTSKERRLFVNPNLKLSVKRQCSLLGVERSGLYYKPDPRPDETVLMNRIYDIWYANPCYGYRRVTKVLRREGMQVNHKRVERLMRVWGREPTFSVEPVFIGC